MNEFREYTSEGKTRYRKAQVELGFDGTAALMEWYERINTCEIYKKFYRCRDNHTMTEVSQWSVTNSIVKAKGKGYRD